MNTTIKTKTTHELLKYQFTHDELHQKGVDLARMNSEMLALDNEKKSVVADFKAKIEGKTAEVELTSNHINNGYEYRRIECEIRFNDPSTGWKTVVRKDNGEVVRKEQMTEEELQYELELDNQ